MLRRLLGSLWRGAPKSLRRWSVRLIEPRFTVSTGAVVLDERGRVLLLNHVFRTGHGWGIPGGFIGKGEQPDEALRRELREEVGLELESARLAFARTLKKQGQVEIVFRCRARGPVRSRSLEVKSAEWFALDALPQELTREQHRVIQRALNEEQ